MFEINSLVIKKGLKTILSTVTCWGTTLERGIQDKTHIKDKWWEVQPTLSWPTTHSITSPWNNKKSPLSFLVAFQSWGGRKCGWSWSTFHLISKMPQCPWSGQSTEKSSVERWGWNGERENSYSLALNGLGLKAPFPFNCSEADRVKRSGSSAGPI